MKQILTVSVIALAAWGCSNAHDRGDDAGMRTGDAGVGVDAGDDNDAGGGGCVLPTPVEHRAAEEACPMDRPTRPITEMPQSFWDCESHEECTDGINGRCQGTSFHGYRCTYDTCFSDSDCSAGPCLCRGAAGGIASGNPNSCRRGNCQTDADCGPGGFCSPTLGSCGDYGGTVGYYCHTCEDECTDDSDCAEPDGYCAYDEVGGRWRCQDSHCAG